MKIYILYFADYDAFDLKGVYKSKEKAESEIPALDQKYFEEMKKLYARHPTLQQDEITLENMHHIMELELIE